MVSADGNDGDDMELRSLFIDFNAYFASVEQQDRPELRGRPIAVTPVLTANACCIAASLWVARPHLRGLQQGSGRSNGAAASKGC